LVEQSGNYKIGHGKQHKRQYLFIK